MFDDGLHPPGPQKRPPLHRQLRLSCAAYPNVHALGQALIADPAFEAMTEASNSLVVNRMGYSDHGMTHVLIAATNAMMLFESGLKLGWEPSFTKLDGDRHDHADSAAVVLLSSLLHDVGNSIARERHWELGLPLAQSLLERLLPRTLRADRRQKLILAALECIYTHDSSVMAYSLEGSILKLADAMDCEAGRSRLAPPSKNPDKRYAASNQAIDFVHLGPVAKGKRLPVWFELNSKAGIFQLEEIVAKRIDSGVLKDKVVAEAFIEGKRIWKWPK